MKKFYFFAYFKSLLIFIGLIFFSNLLFSQTSFFRSRTSGNWNTAGSWQISADGGGSWSNSTVVPTATTAVSILIQRGHTITLNASFTVMGLVVESGGTLRAPANNTLTIANGVGTDMIVYGTWWRSSGFVSISSNATISIEAGGRYIHDRTGNIIPLATWDKTSVLELRQFTSTPTQFNQSFGRIELGSNVNGFANDVTFNGDLHLLNSNFTFVTSNNVTRSIKVNGNLTGASNINLSGVQNNGSVVLEVTGNMDLNTGKFNGTNSSNGSATYKIGGDFHAGKEFVGAQNNADFNLEVGGNFSVDDKFTALNGNGSASFEVGGNFLAGKDFVAAQNNGKVNFTIGGDFFGDAKMVFTNGNNANAINVFVRGNWLMADETVGAQNNAGVDILVKGNVYGGSKKFTGVSGNGKFIMLIEGDLLYTEGEFNMATNQGECVVTVLKNFLFSGSQFLFTSSNGSKRPQLNVAGNMSLTSGKFQVINGQGEVNLNGNGQMQVFTSGTNYSGTIDFFVRSGAYVQMNEANTFVGGLGKFTLETGASLGIRSAAGITTSGTTCHIQVSGSRSYNYGANYIYNGTISQVTGNGLVEGAQVHVDNTAGVTTTQNVTVNKNLLLLKGLLTTTATKLVTVSNRSTDAIEGGGPNTFINGPVLWYVQATEGIYSFPIGKVSNGQSIFRFCRVAEVSGSGGFRAEYFQAIPPGRVNNKYYALFQDLMVGILENEYWQIDRIETLGKPEARVILPYNPSLVSKKWLGVDGTSISPASSSNVAIVKGINDNSIWNFAYDPNFLRPSSTTSDAALSLPYQQDGELISGSVTSFSPFSFGFGYFKTLPVVLKQFSALLNAQKVQLRWEIAGEKDLNQFDVEHSTDGRSFTKIGTVPSSGATSFNYEHLQPVSGKNYYRLAILEKDGNKHYSSTALVQYGRLQTVIQGLLQNPVASQQAILLTQSASRQRLDIQVMDLNGRVLLRKSKQIPTGASRISVSLSGIPSGYYRMLLHSEDGVYKELPLMMQ